MVRARKEITSSFGLCETELNRLERGTPFPCGKGDEVAASPNEEVIPLRAHNGSLKACSLSLILEEKPLIHDISIEFSPGVLYGILGPNGSGKSTLLKTLSGIWNPSSGTVLWQDEELFKKNRREISKILTLVPQNPQVHFNFTVFEMVAMGRYSYGMRGNEKQVEEALSIVDAWHLRHRSILCISHGERKRVYIARALMTESPVLLLDEPEASLDIRHQLEIWQLLKGLSQRGKIIVVTSHDLISTERFCDRIALLDHGRCLSFGTYEEVISDKRLGDVFGVERKKPLVQKQAMFSLP